MERRKRESEIYMRLRAARIQMQESSSEDDQQYQEQGSSSVLSLL